MEMRDPCRSIGSNSEAGNDFNFLIYAITNGDLASLIVQELRGR